MSFFPVLIFLFTLIVSNYGNALSRSYLTRRMNIIKEENDMAFGSSIGLSPPEELANQCLMKAKHNEVDYGYKHPTEFLPSQNYLEVSEKIKKSLVYQMIRKMPKGALFHAHISSMLPPNELMKFTYEPNLYICKHKNNFKFKFAKHPGKNCDWKLLSDVRKRDSQIDEKIKSSLVLRRSKFEDINVVWTDFEEIFDIVKGIITYRPVFEKYLRGVLEEVYRDNIMLIEVRSSASQLYELDGHRLDSVKSSELAFSIVNKFMQEHPDFLGMKIIYSPHRDSSEEKLQELVTNYKRLKAAFPKNVIGFDFVGQEDKLPSLFSIAHALEKLPSDTQFFFHAGETNWYGHPSDLNLVDAVLFNTKRIGHGFALPKHPKVMEIVKNKGIAIEINPISNQVLKLVDDLRNHPASQFFAQNLAVVVSSDDPSYWEAKSLSSDFYETFIGIMSRNADLRSLKQLALNSINYSGLTDAEKHAAHKVFRTKWQKYIDQLTKSKYCSEINETT